MAHSMLECPLYKLIRDKFPLIFENIVLGNLKYIFQLDHQVDISLHLTPPHYKISWFKNIFVHFQSH